MIDIFGRCIGYHSINLSAVYSFRLFFFWATPFVFVFLLILIFESLMTQAQDVV
jgi:hypothetical protein